MPSYITTPLRITKRDGSFIELFAAKYQATKRSGAFCQFSFAATGRVRITKRDGSFIDLTDFYGGGSPHNLSFTMYCSTCGAVVGGCLTCDWLSCGHSRTPPCPEW